MATLQSVIDRAISVAASKGLTSSKRVTVVNEIGGAEIMLVVSYNEPHSVEAPLNLVWINGDPAHADYKVARKRASRAASGGFTHTWSLLTDYTQLTQQYWDIPEPEDNDHNLHNANIDNPHRTTPDTIGALATAGGKMTGALELKDGSTLAEFTDKEAVPAWWVRLLVGPIQILASQVRQSQSGMLTQINSLRNRVTILEGRIQAKGYVHVQAEAASEWAVNHKLSNDNINITIYDEQGQLVLTDVYHIDLNNLVVKFAQPQSGKASLQAVAV